MERKYLLHELSQKDKRLFYSQEVFEDYSSVKIRLILMIIFSTLCDILLSRVVHPLVDGEPVASLFTLDLLGLVIGIAIYSLSFSRPFQKKTKRIIRLRDFLNSSASLMLSIYVFYLQYDRVQTALITKDEAKWMRAYVTLSQAIYTLLATIMLTPVWYLKAFVVIGYYAGISAAFLKVDHYERFWIGGKCLLSTVYSVAFILLTANFRWKLFLKGLEADAWNQVYTDILDRNPSSIAVMQANGQIIYSNSGFKKLTAEDPESFFKKVTNIKSRITQSEHKIYSPCSMSGMEESKDLLQPPEDPFSRLSSASAHQRTIRVLHPSFHSLSDILEHYRKLADNHQFANSDQAIFDGKLNRPHVGMSLSYEIIIRPLAEYKKFILILNDTTERDLVVALENNNEYKDQLLASVSHELRTPLNGTLGFLQSAIHDNTISNPVKEKFLLPALRSGRLLSHLISDILDYSMLQSEKLALSFELKPLRETINYCYQLLENAFVAKKLTFNLIIDGRLPSKFKTDHDRLTQIVLNLLSNALKFTMKGGVTIEVWCVSGNAEIRVKDTGIGIKNEDIPKLFEEIAVNEKKFDERRHSKGAGLGLKVASRLARLIGSGDKDMYVESTEGQGTTFSFEVEDKSEILIRKDKHHTLSDRLCEDTGKGSEQDKNSLSGIDVPIETSGEGEQMVQEVGSYLRQTWLKLKDTNTTMPRLSTSNVRLQDKKRPILIVDDDPFNIIALESLLSHLGITVEAASNGKQAIDKVLEDPTLYQLIFMDCQMPVMNGYEATKKLIEKMQQGIVPTIPIIGCTAFSAKDKVDECIKCGMKEVIFKPVIMNKLKKVVELYLSN